MPKGVSASLFALIGLLAWQLYCQLRGAGSVTCDSWGLTDWLVNYSGGFVRRGLGGTVLCWLNGITGVKAHYLAILVSLGCYLGLTSWLLLKASHRFPPALLLSGVVMGFPVYQYSLVRKDCLLLLLLIAALACMRSEWRSWHRWGMINLLSCAAVLFHETFAFFAIPALVVLGAGDSLRRCAVHLLALAPAIGCCLLVMRFHGSAATARAIHDSWLPLWHQAAPGSDLLERPFATIQSIGWTREEGMLMTKGVLQTGIYQPIAWLGVALICVVVIGRFIKEDDNGRTFTDMALVLAFQLLCIAPLFVLGVDYGRWLFFWIVSSIILFVMDCRVPVGGAFRMTVHRVLGRLNMAAALLPRRDWVFLLIGMPVLWSLRNFVVASPLGRLVSEISGSLMLR